jgi:hypothetical protein
LNPAFRTQPIREGIDFNNTIKKNGKEEITQRHQGETGMLGKLYRGVAGRQCYNINNLCCSLYIVTLKIINTHI